MGASADHVREILKRLSEMEAALADLSERVKHTQELLRQDEILTDWSLRSNLEERPHLGVPG